MSFSPITHLRHVDVAVPDYDKQVEFYKNQWGLATTGSERDVSYFAAEGSPEQYIVRVRKSAEKRLDLVAFGAADRASVDALAARLGSQGVKIVSEPDVLQTPGGGYGFRFFDIDGRTVEVSADVETRKHRKIEKKEDIPVRLSHIVLNAPDPEATSAWYEKHLDFRLSDQVAHPRIGGLFWFLRCSPQHHSIAIAKGPHASLNHASFELRDIDEFLCGSARLVRADIPKLWGPGKHRGGDNTFSYFTDPNGNTMEYTTELVTIDEDTWHPSIYDASEPETNDVWGIANQMNEFISKSMFNDPDKGVFVAPPM